MTIVAKLKYEGSINNFRALMDSFIITFGYYWKSPNSELLGVSYEPELRAPGREAWRVILEHDKLRPKILVRHYATIFAHETIPNVTQIQFDDGKLYFGSGQKMDFNDPGSLTYTEWLPIGESIILLSKEIEQQWLTDTATKNLELWEQIPNIGWNRDAVRLWYEGYTTAEIAKRVRKDEQTVRNKIANLRREHGENIIPVRRK